MPDALILGCSHAAGALMHEDPEYGAQNSYPIILAELLGYTPHNHAISGGSNDAMFRIYTEQEQHFDLIIACWTGMDRGEYFHPTHKQWIPINYGEGESFIRKSSEVLKQGIPVGIEINDKQMYEDYGKQWLAVEGNEQRGFTNRLKNILALNSLAQHRDTKVINCDSFQGQHVRRDKPFRWPESVYRPLNGSRDEFVGYCTVKGFPNEPRGHYYRPAHESYALHIKHKLDNTRNPLND
tara:strand:- start:354 stop:1070 length:717 start_codon:yes stop_codon:yes gene_type:complete